MKSPEEYRKKPIFGTDFSKTVPEIIEDIRRKISDIRGNITDIGYGYPGYKDKLEHVEGLLTCGLSVLYHERKEIIKQEIKWEDKKSGESISFNPRGIGLDNCPWCFVCGGEGGMMSNISAFVRSKEDGGKIVSWFNDGAWLDYRVNEPEWIQVKIGACRKHLPNLEKLSASCGSHGVLRAVDVVAATDII